MNIPRCPNNAKSTAICEQSKLRLLGETDTSFLFTCACCGLLWSISKPKTKAAARWENQVRKVQEASNIERQRSQRRLYSFPKG